MQGVPDWVWLLIGGGVIGTILTRLLGRGAGLRGAKTVAKATRVEAERQQAEAVKRADDEHKAATVKAEAEAGAVNAAGMTDLADLANMTFGADDE